MIYASPHGTAAAEFIKAIVKPNEYIVFLYDHGRVRFEKWEAGGDFCPKRGKNIDVEFDDPFYELTEINREE